MSDEKEINLCAYEVYYAKMLGVCCPNLVNMIEKTTILKSGKNIWEEMRIRNGFETTEDEESFFRTFKQSSVKQRKELLTIMKKAKVDSKVIHGLKGLIHIPN